MTELFENDKGGFSDEHRTTLRTMSRIRNADSGARRQVPHKNTLVQFESFACEDPRDRLYALHGVIQKWIPSSCREIRELDRQRRLPVVNPGRFHQLRAMLMIELDDVLPPDIQYNPVTHMLQLGCGHPAANTPRRAPGVGRSALVGAGLDWYPG